MSAENLIRPPQQRRSAESFERVIAAGFDLLRERGFDGFTLQEVSRRARVSIGSIYSRVPSREALILAIYDRAMAQIGEQERQRIRRDPSLAGLTPRQQVELLVSDLAYAMLENADTLRVFMRQAPFSDEIWSRGSRHSIGLAELFSAALLTHGDMLTPPHPEIAVDVAFRMVYCTVARRITHGPAFESDRPVADDELIAELSRAVAAYLLASD